MLSSLGNAPSLGGRGNQQSATSKGTGGGLTGLGGASLGGGLGLGSGRGGASSFATFDPDDVPDDYLLEDEDEFDNVPIFGMRKRLEL